MWLKIVKVFEDFFRFSKVSKSFVNFKSVWKFPKVFDNFKNRKKNQVCLSFCVVYKIQIQQMKCTEYTEKETNAADHLRLNAQVVMKLLCLLKTCKHTLKKSMFKQTHYGSEFRKNGQNPPKFFVSKCF